MSDALGDQPRWRLFAEALRSISKGTKPEDINGELVMELVVHNLLRNEEQTKPCRTCGTPRVDFRFWKISAAGRLLVEALEQEPA